MKAGHLLILVPAFLSTASGAVSMDAVKQQEAGADSAATRSMVWNEVTWLPHVRHAADVAFVAMGRNIINPGQMLWAVEAGGSMVVSASLPIQDTAEAGEEMGRRALGLRDPRALVAVEKTNWVLDGQDVLHVFRSGSRDSMALQKGPAGARDLAVGVSGLIYVLLGREVRVYVDPPRGAPLWTLQLEPDLLPAVAVAVSARGEIYIAGQGTTAVAVYDLDALGRFKRARSATARALGARVPAGLALAPAMLVPLETKEGWLGEDRFVVLADAGGRALLALDPATLKPIGRWQVEAALGQATPGSIDISNRGQIACVDPESGAAYVLPTRVFANLVESVKIPWRPLGGTAAPKRDPSVRRIESPPDTAKNRRDGASAGSPRP